MIRVVFRADAHGTLYLSLYNPRCFLVPKHPLSQVLCLTIRELSVIFPVFLLKLSVPSAVNITNGEDNEIQANKEYQTH